MSTNNWTPGPWIRSRSKESGGSFIEHIDWDNVGHTVAFVHASHGMFDPPIATDEDSANANLIAAAPELVALVSKVASLNPDAGEIGPGMLRQIVSEARLAEHKAKGGVNQ